jgi:hypothetical protein
MSKLFPIGFGFVLFLLLLPGCGANVVVEDADEPDASVNMPLDASADGPDAEPLDAAVDAADADPPVPPQCLCPDAPGYAKCIAPLQCCPVVAQCKDPATFNCTGSTMMCP